jgi:hypothetical protein
MNRGVQIEHLEEEGADALKAESDRSDHSEKRESPRFSELDREHGDEADQAKRIAEEEEPEQQ